VFQAGEEFAEGFAAAVAGSPAQVFPGPGCVHEREAEDRVEEVGGGADES
jgi:hypothetical protein